MGQLDTSSARLSGLLADAGPVPRLSVLLIDNDRIRAEVLLRQLGPMARFRLACSVGEAAAADAQEPADLILVSDDLPQASLRAFTTLWRRASVHPATPVVGVGTGTNLLDEVFAHRCGVLAWLPRDAGADLLRARLAMMLSLLQRPGVPSRRDPVPPIQAPSAVPPQVRLVRSGPVAPASPPASPSAASPAERLAAATPGEPVDPLPSDALISQLHLEVARARRVQRPMALLWVRVDHLDRHAAQQGTDGARHCLDALAGQLRGIARRATDLLLRHGDDGHVLLLSETSEAGARALARRIVAEAAGGLIPRRPPTARPLTVSVGVACWQPSGPADDRGLALLTTATLALRQAQRQGRNCSRVLAVPGRADAALEQQAPVPGPSAARAGIADAGWPVLPVLAPHPAPLPGAARV
ncbi:MAG: hypothetical protein RLY78_81 [Pseudomonadota bacterium]